jgi:hypothetical protein
VKSSLLKMSLFDISTRSISAGNRTLSLFYAQYKRTIDGGLISEYSESSVMVKALCYKTDVAGSKPDEVNEFSQFT